MVDNPAQEVGEALLDCVREALAASPNQSPSRAYLAMGEPAWDDCCDGAGGGQLVVWWSNLYGSADFPNSDTRPVLCQSPITAITFNIEIVRCAPSSGPNGEPPSAEALGESTREANVDARAVWRGAVCCLREHAVHPWNWSSIITGQVPVGPDGGCVGSRLTLTVGVIDGCGCT